MKIVDYFSLLFFWLTCFSLIIDFRYGFLLRHNGALLGNPLSVSVAILRQFGISPDMYQVGYTKLFLRTGQVSFTNLSFLFFLCNLSLCDVDWSTGTSQRSCAFRDLVLPKLFQGLPCPLLAPKS